MLNTLEMINVAIARRNEDKKDIESKHVHYLESFKSGNHEEEYQAYVSSRKEVEEEVFSLIGSK